MGPSKVRRKSLTMAAVVAGRSPDQATVTMASNFSFAKASRASWVVTSWVKVT